MRIRGRVGANDSGGAGGIHGERRACAPPGRPVRPARRGLGVACGGGDRASRDDIVVVLSKCVSCSQGRLVDIGGVVVSEAAACVQVFGKPSPVQARPARVGPHSRCMRGFVMAETRGGQIAPMRAQTGSTVAGRPSWTLRARTARAGMLAARSRPGRACSPASSSGDRLPPAKASTTDAVSPDACIDPPRRHLLCYYNGLRGRDRGRKDGYRIGKRKRIAQSDDSFKLCERHGPSCM